jgi:hypothetical protein
MIRMVRSLVVALVLFHGSIAANVIHVPGSVSTIQEAVNLALPHDSIIVADGYYSGGGNRDIELLGKPIVLISQNGPA